MPDAIYDDKLFFENYLSLRKKEDNYNDLIEQPNVLSHVGDVTNKKVLDIGCGFGTLTIALSKLKPKIVLGIDNSIRMIELAKQINSASNIRYEKVDANDIGTIKEQFDCVCSSLTFHYIKDFDALIRGISILLPIGGKLLFSQEHPLLTAGKMGVQITDLSEGIAVKSYSQDGERHVEWLGKEVIKYHRKISSIINTLLNNGFVIDKILEPLPDDELINRHKRMLAELQRPSYLIVKCTKTY
jgi:SAM-dependent methyltransferase